MATGSRQQVDILSRASLDISTVRAGNALMTAFT